MKGENKINWSEFRNIGLTVCTNMDSEICADKPTFGEFSCTLSGKLYEEFLK